MDNLNFGLWKEKCNRQINFYFNICLLVVSKCGNPKWLQSLKVFLNHTVAAQENN